MDIEFIRNFCKKLPGVTEGIKWENDLCFMIAEKMFCVTCLNGPPTLCFKVRDEEFDELSNSPGIIPAPYVARYKWVLVEDSNRLSKKQAEHYMKQSYDLIKSKLSKKLLNKAGLTYKKKPRPL